MRTFVYVDAFNLYYGCLKGTPYKWLDLARLCALMLPSHRIERIKYFRARIGSRANDPEAPRRQQTYLRALRTIPGLEIFYGHFLTHPVQMRLANPQPNQSAFVWVIKTDEKGSDVNLATQLLCDAYNRRFECAVIVSGDSDLLAPVRVVMNELKLPVGVLNPQQRPCRVLQKQATFYKHIRAGVLAASQFPDTLTDAHGTFSKPSDWSMRP
ncbi:MAG: NYN domain-containing protein [Verrucomicrobiae bacterium]|nr:NYN domain-containing protein [Verrucomicrobiae bacterium]MDW8309780.1 NYN domain-containing protein [Verrucomicrobiales bacterium]